jgi:hypothetical protein
MIPAMVKHAFHSVPEKEPYPSFPSEVLFLAPKPSPFAPARADQQHKFSLALAQLLPSGN